MQLDEQKRPKIVDIAENEMLYLKRDQKLKSMTEIMDEIAREKQERHQLMLEQKELAESTR